MAKAKKKAKKVAKAKPKAKAKTPKKKAKASAKAKAKPKAKAKAKKAKPAAKPMLAAMVNPNRKPADAEPDVEPEPAAESAAHVVTNGATNGAANSQRTGIAPFSLAETEPGKFSLLLTEFEPAGSVFQAAGLEGGGYAWEGIAHHVAEVIAPEIDGRFELDPEASMFCAYGEDRVALERLGAELARLFHDANTLAAVIQQIGPDGFED